MKTILAALLSLTAGCSGASNVYHVDSRFTPEEQRAISAANDMWCTASHGQLCMDLVFGARVDVGETTRQAIVKSGDRAAQYRYREQIATEARAAFFHQGGTLDSNMIVVLYERMAPENLRVAVAHEMGHAFGITTHLPDPEAIMCDSLRGAASKEVVTCADLRAAGVTCD